MSLARRIANAIMPPPRHEGMTREFTENDWHGFAGAERFDDGSEPVCASRGEYFLVADANGATAFDEDSEYAITLPFPTQAAARHFLDHMPATITEHWLEKLGFRKI